MAAPGRAGGIAGTGRSRRRAHAHGVPVPTGRRARQGGPADAPAVPPRDRAPHAPRPVSRSPPRRRRRPAARAPCGPRGRRARAGAPRALRRRSAPRRPGDRRSIAPRSTPAAGARGGRRGAPRRCVRGSPARPGPSGSRASAARRAGSRRAGTAGPRSSDRDEAGARANGRTASTSARVDVEQGLHARRLRPLAQDGPDPGESVEPGPADEVQQHGLRLVVERVPLGDNVARRSRDAGRSRPRAASRRPRLDRLSRRRGRRRRPADGTAAHAARRAASRTSRRPPIRRAAGGRSGRPRAGSRKSRTEPDERLEQAHGVRTARDADEDGVPGLEHVVFADRRRDPLEDAGDGRGPAGIRPATHDARDPRGGVGDLVDGSGGRRASPTRG